MLVRLSHPQWVEMTGRENEIYENVTINDNYHQVGYDHILSLLDLHNKMHDHLLFIDVYFINPKFNGYKKKWLSTLLQ